MTGMSDLENHTYVYGCSSHVTPNDYDRMSMTTIFNLSHWQSATVTVDKYLFERYRFIKNQKYRPLLNICYCWRSWRTNVKVKVSKYTKTKYSPGEGRWD
jgi:hypothetical protein